MQANCLERLRALNDELRQRGHGGEVYVTAGLDSYGPETVFSVLRAVAAFDAFTEDNDPYGEHDFGAIEIVGLRVLFKIDYYDLQGRYHSLDPSDPRVTRRIMTVMLAHEY